MARAEVAAVLASAGLPVVYYKWPDGSVPSFPCVRYASAGAGDFMADDTNYLKVDRWTATLVSEWKDDASEALVEDALSGAGIAYSKGADYYSDTERLNHVEYTFETPR